MFYPQYFSLFIFGITISMSGPLLGQMETAFQVDSAEIGLLFSFFSVGFLISVLLQYFGSAKFTLARSAVAGQLLHALSLTGFCVNPQYESALALYLLAGFAGGAIQISANAIVARQAREGRSFALSILHLCFGLGALSGPLLASVLVDRMLSWRWAYGLNAAGALLAFVWIWSASRGHIQLMNPDQEREGSIPWSQFRKEPLIALIGLSILLYVGVEMAINSWATLYIQARTSLDAALAGTGVSYFWAAMTSGRLLMAYASRKIPPALLVLLLTIFAGLAYFAFLHAETGFGVLLCLTLTGFAFSGLFPLYLGLAGGIFPAHIKQITAMAMISLGIGFMIFPWLVGQIKESANIGLAMQSLLWPLVCMIGLSIPLLGKRHRSAAAAG
ncbi:MAG: MFS transporter [Leptospiraceae bacterium]|nr:MFS transporter [Leptospiraceae bacterium]